MVNITLEPADNGTIKTIIDDNSNGAGNHMEIKTVYDFEKGNYKRKIEFFHDLAKDLGFDTGNDYEKANLIMSIGWGKSYIPTENELVKKIKTLKLEIEALEMMIETDNVE